MRLVDAKEAEKRIKAMFKDSNPYGMGLLLRFIRSIPTIEAEPVKHGRWLGLHDGWYYSYSCSECGAEALTKEGTMHDQVCSAYCPNCGTNMRGGCDEQVRRD